MKSYSRSLCLLLCGFLLYSPAPSAQSATATVVSVIRGDGLKIRDGNGERLVALYGVRILTLSSAHRKDAKQFVSEMLLGETVSLRTLTEKAGLSYVEVTLPGGSILNHLLIRQGLAKVDSLTARRDVVYTQLEKESREEGLGIWSRRGWLTDELPQRESTARANTVSWPRASVPKDVLSLAKFETQYVKWKSLPQDQRRQYMEYLVSFRERIRTRDNARTASRSRAVDNAAAGVKASSKRIAGQQRNLANESMNRQSAIATAYDDFDLNWNSSMAKRLRKEQAVNNYVGDEYLADIDGEEAYKYEIKASWDRERVNAEARSISGHYDKRIAGIRRTLGYLNKERRALQQTKGTAEAYIPIALNLAAKNEARINRFLRRFEMLEQAIENDYSPTIETKIVNSWTELQPRRLLVFSTESHFWRLDWFVSRERGQEFKATLRSRDDDLAAVIIDDKPLHQSFRVFHRPGSYDIEVEAAEGVRWKLDVVEFEYQEDTGLQGRGQIEHPTTAKPSRIDEFSLKRNAAASSVSTRSAGIEWSILNQEVLELLNTGRYGRAVVVAKRALDVAEEDVGPNHLDVATSLSRLAFVYLNLDQYVQAKPLYRRALEIREKALGPDHLDVATSLSRLALLHENQEEYARAESLHERALEIREKALGPDHPDVGTSLNSLGALYRNQGEYARAESLHERALRIFEKAPGPDHLNVAASLTSLAHVYYNLGQYARAESLLRRLLEIGEKLGPDHPDVGTSLNNLAGLYQATKRDEEAETLE